MWLWAVAVLMTLFGLGLALRALVRTEQATERLRRANDELDTLPPLTVALEAATRDAARERMVLHTRTQNAGD